MGWEVDSMFYLSPNLRNPLPTADWSLHDGLSPKFGPRMSNLCDREKHVFCLMMLVHGSNEHRTVKRSLLTDYRRN